MAALSEAQIRQAVTRYFGDLGPSVVNLMTRIAVLESGGNNAAVGDNYLSGHQARDSAARFDYGLFQINGQHEFDPRLLTSDLNYNLRAARMIFDRQGPTAWSTYQTAVGNTGGTGARNDAVGPTPQEIQAKIQALRTGRPEDTAELQAYLKALPPESLRSWQQWVNSPEGLKASGRDKELSGALVGAGLLVGAAQTAPLAAGATGLTPSAGSAAATYAGTTAAAVGAGAIANQQGFGVGQAQAAPTQAKPGDGGASLAQGITSITDIVRQAVEGSGLDQVAALSQAGFTILGMGSGRVSVIAPTGDIIEFELDENGILKPVKDPADGATYDFQVAPDGTVFRASSTGAFERLDTFPELAEKPNIQTLTGDDGITYGFNPQTGELTPLRQTGFAATDPERTFAEGVRQFDTSQANALAIAREGQAAANTRNTQSETEANRRGVLSAQTSGFQSVNQLAPQLGTLALQNAEFTRDVTRNPSDYIARAFFQRGAQSPLPQVSQADILNQLRANIQGFNGVLSGFNPQTQQPLNFGTAAPIGAVPPSAAPPVAAPSQPAAPTAPAGFTPWEGGATENTSGAQFFIDPSGSLVPRFGMGGFTTAPVAVVGDSRSGMPTGFEETVYNPTGAPIAIQPGTQQGAPRYAFGTPPPSPYKGPNAYGGMAVDEGLLDEYNAYQAGDIFGGSAPQLPTPGFATQNQLVSDAVRYSPPAVGQLLGDPGVNATNGLRFGFQLFTPNQLGRLTPDERAALNTRLGVQYNTTLEDVMFEQQRRFGFNPNARQARQLTAA